MNLSLVFVGIVVTGMVACSSSRDAKGNMYEAKCTDLTKKTLDAKMVECFNGLPFHAREYIIDAVQKASTDPKFFEISTGDEFAEPYLSGKVFEHACKEMERKPAEEKKKLEKQYYLKKHLGIKFKSLCEHGRLYFVAMPHKDFLPKALWNVSLFEFLKWRRERRAKICEATRPTKQIFISKAAYIVSIVEGAATKKGGSAARHRAITPLEEEALLVLATYKFYIIDLSYQDNDALEAV